MGRGKEEGRVSTWRRRSVGSIFSQDRVQLGCACEALFSGMSNEGLRSRELSLFCGSISRIEVRLAWSSDGFRGWKLGIGSGTGTMNTRDQ